MGDDIEYRQVNVPDTPREEYTYVERRAEILQLIERAGHPGALNKSELGRRYDVSHTSIGRDFDALAEYYAGNVGEQSAMLTETVYQKAIRELQSEGEHYKAAKVLEMWNNWLFDRGAQEKAPNRSELDVDMRSRSAEVAYQIVRPGDDESLPTVSDSGEDDVEDSEDSEIDYEAIGFTAWPNKEDE